MKKWIMIMAAGLLIASSAAIAEEQAPEQVSPSLQAALDWLGIIDQGEYELSWKESAAYFQQAIDEEQWEDSLSAARGPLQKLLSREMLSTTPATTLPGAPDGEYEVIVFKSAFAKKAQATEVVTVMKDPDGSWRAAGYLIK